MHKTLIALCLILAACAPPPVKGTKVSELPLASWPLNGTEFVMITQDGKSVQLPLLALRSYVRNDIAVPETQ